MPAAADRNLLFGILALQMDFISRDQLVAAMYGWVPDKTRALGQLLLEQKALSTDTHALLEALVQKHLALKMTIPRIALPRLAGSLWPPARMNWLETSARSLIALVSIDAGQQEQASWR